jgi:hypothetical protein
MYCVIIKERFGTLETDYRGVVLLLLVRARLL